mmetsp:Transcript_51901/g.147925  ORF Transcript_51901/g.147925 Transcript_51901/m.147925 type:complete len:394 (+) Transcript_51901:81-1262(+)
MSSTAAALPPPTPTTTPSAPAAAPPPKRSLLQPGSLGGAQREVLALPELEGLVPEPRRDDAALAAAEPREAQQVVRLHELAAARLGRGVALRELAERLLAEEGRPGSDGHHKPVTILHVLYVKLLRLHENLVALQEGCAPEGPLEVGLDHLPPFLEDLLQGPGALAALLHRDPHVGGVVLLQLRVLAQPLDAVPDLAGRAHVHELLLLLKVEDDHGLGVAAGLQVRVVEVLHLLRELEGLRVQVVAAHGDAAVALKLGQLLLREPLDGLLDGLHVLAELRAHRPEVEHADKLDLVGVRPEDDLLDVQLGLDVALEGLQVGDEGLALVHDGHALEGLLEADLPPLAARAAELHDRAHALHGREDLRVQRLGVGLGDPHEVHGLGLHRVPPWQGL